MLSKKPLILILTIASSVHCANDHAQENSLPLLFALSVDNPKIGFHSPGVEKRGSLMLSRFGGYKRPEESGEEAIEKGIEGESEAIEWWELTQEPEANHSDMAKVCFGDDIPLEPDTRYCFLPATSVLPATGVSPATDVSPDPDVEAGAYRRAVSDEGSDTEDSGTSDECSDKSSNEDETGTETDVQRVNTVSDAFQALNEMSQYCATLRLKMINQKSISDGEIPTDSGAEVTEVDPANRLESTLPVDSADQKPKRSREHHCGHEGCGYSTYRVHHLKRHKQIHLPADQRSKVHQCDHEGCNYRSDQAYNLKAHKQIHLPADQRVKRLRKKSRVQQCDHEGCNYRSDHPGNLKAHKQTHLPADQRVKRPKVHQCGHKGCNYRANHRGKLEAHKQTHLPPNRRYKGYRCDHEGCNYSSQQPSHLKRHKRIHLPADQRARGHQCDYEGCNYSTDQAGNLKRHKQIHQPADQRLKKLKRPKRKANDQPSSNKKRKKGNKE
ncbi:hypothetical protein [Endozoicomonas sp. 4G]|uniref:hypothetical protein n=1 Tax=Endozoicomonas sp. 4G TaxID=2872754 RepID=UPI0020788C06|nr:hypothetical protein [Endozoicomonas sp. 4G]